MNIRIRGGRVASAAEDPGVDPSPPLRSGSPDARPRRAALATAAIHPHPAAILHSRSTLAPPVCNAWGPKISRQRQTRGEEETGGARLRARNGR